jgi:hypothetical protein
MGVGWSVAEDGFHGDADVLDVEQSERRRSSVRARASPKDWLEDAGATSSTEASLAAVSLAGLLEDCGGNPSVTARPQPLRTFKAQMKGMKDRYLVGVDLAHNYIEFEHVRLVRRPRDQAQRGHEMPTTASASAGLLPVVCRSASTQVNA